MKILTPLIFKITCLLIVMTYIFSACRKDEHDISPDEINPYYPTIQLTPANPDWSKTEQRFFNITDSHNDNVGANTRSDDLPNILTLTFNKIVSDHEQENFINGVVGRIGYPRWLDAHVVATNNGVNHMINIPFQKPDENITSAYLTGYMSADNTKMDDLRLDIQLRHDLHEIGEGNKATTRNTCLISTTFCAFDSLLYQHDGADLDEVWCTSCFGDSNNLTAQNADTRCENVEVTIC